nr:MBOAT family O-acyltransferase [Tissierella sp.]
MLFSSTVFIFLFLPLVLIGYYVLFKDKRKVQNAFLFLTSLLFYAWGEPRFVFVMLLSILGNWIFGLLVDKYRDHIIARRLVIVSMLIFNLSIIFIFKYLMFTLGIINNLLKFKITIPNIVLPIGISFFTFQAISYVIDIYRKNGQVQKNPLNVGLYISFFPQLIAGPIVRYQTVADQIENRVETFDDFSEGVVRFITGLAKKVLIANNMAIVADKAFALQGDQITVVFAWLGALAYTFQIFFDFGGYSDMAIGLGKMFGFHFDENFNYPYISKSISEFWRRWHISLGSWFRDYVYFPLGGSRVANKSKLIFNLFVVWFLTGVWHGANWTFIAWGIFYFIIIAFEKVTDFEKRASNLNWLKHIYTLLLVIVGWVLFRAENIIKASEYLKSMVGLNNNLWIDDYSKLYFMEYKYIYILAIIFSTPLFKWLSNKYKLKDNIFLLPVNILLIIGMFTLSLSYIIKGSYNPFIYFNF